MKKIKLPVLSATFSQPIIKIIGSKLDYHCPKEGIAELLGPPKNLFKTIIGCVSLIPTLEQVKLKEIHKNV